jgi:hypothetical protein
VRLQEYHPYIRVCNLSWILTFKNYFNKYNSVNKDICILYARVIILATIYIYIYIYISKILITTFVDREDHFYFYD